MGLNFLPTFLISKIVRALREGENVQPERILEPLISGQAVPLSRGCLGVQLISLDTDLFQPCLNIVSTLFQPRFIIISLQIKKKTTTTTLNLPNVSPSSYSYQISYLSFQSEFHRTFSLNSSSNPHLLTTSIALFHLFVYAADAR